LPHNLVNAVIEADRTEKDREREQQLLQDLVSTIEGRNAIVESMHEDKQR